MIYVKTFIQPGSSVIYKIYISFAMKPSWHRGRSVRYRRDGCEFYSHSLNEMFNIYISLLCDEEKYDDMFHHSTHKVLKIWRNMTKLVS